MNKGPIVIELDIDAEGDTPEPTEAQAALIAQLEELRSCRIRVTIEVDAPRVTDPRTHIVNFQNCTFAENVSEHTIRTFVTNALNSLDAAEGAK